MAVFLSPVGGVAAQFFTSTGAVLTGGKLFTYAAGTTTPAATYTSSTGFTAWTNPIVLDAAGRVPGSGEIWLTDGFSYKFVLKDANDVLIATYDNISGINSNLVAYTNSQEIQTATAGQTVFTLTTMQYQPSTNSLSVFVDGVNQYGPGAQYAYFETNGTTVTFANGLHVGAQVKFTTTQQQGAGAVNASQVSYTPGHLGAQITNVQTRLREYVSVKDFGALGDGTGATPASTGYDITNESWNTWDWTAFKTNAAYSPYYVGGVFTPPKAKPFDNNDTWDYIGISLALWQDLAVYIPPGDYRINVNNGRGAYTGLIMMKGQEKPIFGAGAYKSIITTVETDSFFSSHFQGTANKYQLLTLYRTSAVPSVWRDLVFSGPFDFGAANNNLTLIYATNTNGVSWENLWMTSASRGIYQDSAAGDCRCHMITTEYLFRSSVETDSTCDITIEFCDIWASASLSVQQGVILGREGRVTNCKFVDFNGPSFTAVRGVFANNYVTTATASSYVVKFTDTCTVTGNQFDVTSAGPTLVAYKNASVIGNTFKQTAAHPCLNLGDGTSATNITVSGNTFIKTDATVDPQNYAITAETGSGFFNAAASTVLISNNTFQGRANTAFGAATFIANSINGNVSSAYESNHTNTIDATITNAGTGKIVNQTDIAGNNILNGTGNGASFAVTLGSQLIGYNGGTARDQERLILVSIYTSAAHQAGSGYALYTNDYNGNRVLIATLGTHCSGGTISFGASTTDVVITVTNSTDATTDYVVNAVPLI